MLGNLHCSNFYFLLFLILLLGAKAPNQTWFDTMLGEKEILSYSLVLFLKKRVQSTYIDFYPPKK